MSTNTATTASYVANGSLLAGGAFSFSEWMMLGGFVLGLATFTVNFYFQLKRDKRERQKQETYE